MCGINRSGPCKVLGFCANHEIRESTDVRCSYVWAPIGETKNLTCCGKTPSFRREVNVGLPLNPVGLIRSVGAEYELHQLFKVVDAPGSSSRVESTAHV